MHDEPSHDDALLVFTTDRCGDCRVAKMTLDRLGIAYREVDIGNDADAAAYVMRINGGRRSVPTLAYRGDAESMSRFSRERLDAFLARNALSPS